MMNVIPCNEERALDSPAFPERMTASFYLQAGHFRGREIPVRIEIW